MMPVKRLKLVVINPWGLGDLVMMAQALRKFDTSTVELCFVTRRHPYSSLVNFMFSAQQAIGVNFRSVRLLALICLSFKKFDVAVLHPGLRSKWRVLAWCLSKNTVPDLRRTSHIVDRYCASFDNVLLRRMETRVQTPCPPTDCSPFEVIHPFSSPGQQSKVLPDMLVDALSERIRARGNRPVLIGTESEIKTVGSEITAERRAVPGNFLELSKVLTSAQAVHCSDSFIGHFASYLGVQVYSYFGPTDPKLSAPSKAIVHFAAIKCSPCHGTPFIERCPYEQQCLKILTPGLARDLSADDLRN
jgi:ADP-heptose:LPS heptosyltransferase